MIVWDNFFYIYKKVQFFSANGGGWGSFRKENVCFLFGFALILTEKVLTEITKLVLIKVSKSKKLNYRTRTRCKKNFFHNTEHTILFRKLTTIKGTVPLFLSDLVSFFLDKGHFKRH